MKLVYIRPESLSHRASETTTVAVKAKIEVWLKQWTVPNNYGHVLIDLDAKRTLDPLQIIARSFLRDYENVIGKSSVEVTDEFTFEIGFDYFTLGVPFHPRDGGGARSLSVRNLLLGLDHCLKQRT
jgi:hypothetical protein